MTTYQEKLKDPRWQKKRLEILERDGWSCQRCGDDESMLVVHHRRYFPGKEPWEYENKILITLCENCHDSERSERPDVESDLLSRLREMFLIDGLTDITTGFINMNVLHGQEVVASMLSWIFSNDNIQRELLDRFFEGLKNVKSST
ncbi:MAG: HNH endonuclease [Pseudomonadota bacterium]